METQRSVRQQTSVPPTSWVKKAAQALRRAEDHYRRRLPTAKLTQLEYYFAPLVAGVALTVTLLLIGLVCGHNTNVDPKTKVFLDAALRNFDWNIFKAVVFLLAFATFVVGWRPNSVLRLWVIAPLLSICHYAAMLVAGFAIVLVLLHVPTVSPEKGLREVWVTAVLVFSGLLAAWGAKYCRGQLEVVQLEQSRLYRAGLFVVGLAVMVAFIATHLPATAPGKAQGPVRASRNKN